MNTSPLFQSKNHLWTIEEQYNILTAEKKAEEIQAKINSSVYELMTSPLFQSSCPVVHRCLAESKWNFKPLPTAPSNHWIQKELLPFLQKEGPCTIFHEFTLKLYRALQELTPCLEKKKIEDLSIYYEFLTHLHSFINRNQQEFDDPTIIDTMLYGPNKVKKQERITRDAFVINLVKTTEHIDTILFQKNYEDITRYGELLPTYVNIVATCALSLLPPNQYTSTRSDNPLELGLALSHNIQEKRKHELLKQLCQDPTQIENMKNDLMRMNERIQPLLDANDTSSHYKFFVNIMNSGSLEELPLPLHLRAFVILSEKNQDLAPYFKKEAIAFGTRLLKFESEAKTAPSQPDCLLM